MNAFAKDVGDQSRIGEGLGPLELILPKRKALHHDARFHQDMEFNAGEFAGHLVAVATRALEDHGKIGIAVRLVIAARAASLDNAVNDGIFALELFQESAHGAFRVGVKRRFGG